jgi:hypothetical protein
MEDKGEEAKVLPQTVRPRIRSCGKQFRDRSRGKNCDENFKILIFCDFVACENLEFCEFGIFRFASIGQARWGPVRRIMIIALARKLVIALWRYVETGKVPTGAIVTA